SLKPPPGVIGESRAPLRRSYSAWTIFSREVDVNSFITSGSAANPAHCQYRSGRVRFIPPANRASCRILLDVLLFRDCGIAFQRGSSAFTIFSLVPGCKERRKASCLL